MAGWRRRSRLMLLIAATALTVIGCKNADAANGRVPEVAIQVDSVQARAISVPRTLRLTGTLRGAQQTELAANVNGRVLRTFVELGQSVKKGELLAQVDVTAAALSLAEARVQVETSKTQQAINAADCERYVHLKAKGVVSDMEYDQVTAKCKTAPLSVDAAEARRSSLAKNVGDGAVRAPFSGVVTERYVEVGEYVQTASRVVSLAQVDTLQLEFSVPEQNFPDVKAGADVSFSVAAYGGQQFAGRVIHISGAVRATRDVLVEAEVANPDLKLLPGMFADVSLTVGDELLPAVPKSAVFEQNGKLNVFVVTEGRAEQRVVQPATDVGDQLPVRQGIRVGETVVSSKLRQLKNGQAVH